MNGVEKIFGSAFEGCCFLGQALSKRIHYGKFVAEAKFSADPAAYTDLIRQNDVEGLMVMLTDANVEAKVGPRVPSAYYGGVKAPLRSFLCTAFSQITCFSSAHTATGGCCVDFGVVFNSCFYDGILRPPQRLGESLSHQ